MDIIIKSDDPIDYNVFRDYLGLKEEEMTKEQRNKLKNFTERMKNIDK